MQINDHTADRPPFYFLVLQQNKHRQEVTSSFIFLTPAHSYYPEYGYWWKFRWTLLPSPLMKWMKLLRYHVMTTFSSSLCWFHRKMWFWIIKTKLSFSFFRQSDCHVVSFWASQTSVWAPPTSFLFCRLLVAPLAWNSASTWSIGSETKSQQNTINRASTLSFKSPEPKDRFDQTFTVWFFVFMNGALRSWCF